MKKDEKVKCAWCEKETAPKIHKEKSDYGKIAVWTCSRCGKILAIYLDEQKTILEKVRTFAN